MPLTFVNVFTGDRRPVPDAAAALELAKATLPDQTRPWAVINPWSPDSSPWQPFGPVPPGTTGPFFPDVSTWTVDNVMLGPLQPGQPPASIRQWFATSAPAAPPDAIAAAPDPFSSPYQTPPFWSGGGSGNGGSVPTPEPRPGVIVAPAAEDNSLLLLAGAGLLLFLLWKK